MTTGPLAYLVPDQMVWVKPRWFLKQKRWRQELSSSEYSVEGPFFSSLLGYTLNSLVASQPMHSWTQPFLVCLT